MKYFKVYGERNTGTNILTELIEKNSCSVLWPCKGWNLSQRIRRIRQAVVTGSSWLGLPSGELSELLQDLSYLPFNVENGWKHAFVGNFPDKAVETLCGKCYDRRVLGTRSQCGEAERGRGILVLFTIRHPISWLYALWRRPYSLHRLPDSFTEFISYKFATVGRENLRRKQFTALELHQKKMQGYLDLSERIARNGGESYIVRFEDIVQDQESVFRAVSENLLNPNAHFTSIDKSTKEKSKDRAFYKQYYQESKWVSEIGGVNYQRAAKEVDWRFYAQFDYSF